MGTTGKMKLGLDRILFWMYTQSAMVPARGICVLEPADGDASGLHSTVGRFSISKSMTAGEIMRFINPETTKTEWTRAWFALAQRVGVPHPNQLGAWQYMGTEGGTHQFRLRAGMWATGQKTDRPEGGNRWEYIPEDK